MQVHCMMIAPVIESGPRTTAVISFLFSTSSLVGEQIIHTFLLRQNQFSFFTFFISFHTVSCWLLADRSRIIQISWMSL